MKKVVFPFNSLLYSCSRIFFLVLLLACCTASSLFAQLPEGINYQAVIRDGGSLLSNQVVDIRFTLLSAGATVYEETQNLTSDERGLISTVIGKGTVLSGTMESVPWETGDVELKVAMDAGSGFVNLGTTPMESVPFSLQAQQVADLSNHLLSDLGDVDSTTLATGNVLTWNGTKWGPGTIEQPWNINGSSINYVGNSVGIRTASPTSTLTVRGNLDMQDLTTGDRKVRMYGSTLGAVEFLGASGSRNAIITNTSGNQDFGFMGVYNSTAQPRAYMEISSNIGRIITRGPANTRNVSMTWLSGCNDCGYVGVNDANSLEAGMYVNSSGQGIVFGDVKNFRMEHPDQPGKEIWYASLEGPEAAAYERGTAQLVNGIAQVNLSEHFAIVAASEGMTVVLTPLSGSSKGLAVTQKSATGFEVEELFDGNGNYEFDWEIKAVRKGYEDYRVIRDESESRPGGTVEEEQEHDKQPAGTPFEEE